MFVALQLHYFDRCHSLWLASSAAGSARHAPPRGKALARTLRLAPHRERQGASSGFQIPLHLPGIGGESGKRGRAGCDFPCSSAPSLRGLFSPIFWAAPKDGAAGGVCSTAPRCGITSAAVLTSVIACGDDTLSCCGALNNVRCVATPLFRPLPLALARLICHRQRSPRSP